MFLRFCVFWLLFSVFFNVSLLIELRSAVDHPGFSCFGRVSFVLRLAVDPCFLYVVVAAPRKKTAVDPCVLCIGRFFS